MYLSLETSPPLGIGLLFHLDTGPSAPGLPRQQLKVPAKNEIYPLSASPALVPHTELF
jgi:hypothetical protein